MLFGLPKEIVKAAFRYVIMRSVGAGAPTWKWLKTVTAEDIKLAL